MLMKEEIPVWFCEVKKKKKMKKKKKF